MIFFFALLTIICPVLVARQTIFSPHPCEQSPPFAKRAATDFKKQ